MLQPLLLAFLQILLQLVYPSCGLDIAFFEVVYCFINSLFRLQFKLQLLAAIFQLLDFLLVICQLFLHFMVVIQLASQVLILNLKHLQPSLVFLQYVDFLYESTVLSFHVLDDLIVLLLL